jgi:hypothetical protein
MLRLAERQVNQPLAAADRLNPTSHTAMNRIRIGMTIPLAPYTSSASLRKSE